jgi:hypothetical protein
VWLQRGDRQDHATLHRIAQVFIQQGKIDEAWQTLLLD